MRPRVSWPTGMEMGRPSSSTTLPLTRPSVPSIAMVLTVFSPRCWATSRMSLGSLPTTVRALRISGRPSSNWTSHDGTNDRDDLTLVSLNSGSHGELALVGDSRQSLGDIAGDGLPDEPGGGASCSAQHDVRGSPMLADTLGTRLPC